MLEADYHLSLIFFFFEGGGQEVFSLILAHGEVVLGLPLCAQIKREPAMNT